MMKQLLLCASLCISIFVSGQISWIHYDTINSAVPGQKATVFAEDSLNNMWVGTFNKGVGCFDGSNWTTYDTLNSGIADNWIRSIAIGPDNKKYFATARGVSVFDGTTWTTYDNTNSPLFLQWSAFSVAIDDSGFLWVGSTHEILRFDGTTWLEWNSTNTSLPNPIGTNCITPDHAGNVWITTGNSNVPVALYKFDGTTVTPLPVLNNCGGQCEIDIYGNPWINCFNYNGGMARYNGSWLTYDIWNSALPDGYLTDVTIDIYDHKWTSDYQGNLCMFDGANWTVYNSSNSPLPNLPIGRTIQDYLGRIWIGTSGDGVHIMDDPLLGVSYQTGLSLLTFPNPSIGEIHFTIPGVAITNVELYNINGDLVQARIGEMKPEEIVLFLSPDTRAGMYTWRLTTENGQVFTGKIAVNQQM